MLLKVNTSYSRLLQVTSSYNRLLHVTLGYYRLLQVITGYYGLLHLLKVTTSDYRLNSFLQVIIYSFTSGL